MRLQLCKPTFTDASPIPEYPRNGNLGVVVENGLRDAAEEGKSGDMAIAKRLSRLGRVPPSQIPHHALEKARPPISITHTPAHMLVTDLRNASLSLF